MELGEASHLELDAHSSVGARSGIGTTPIAESPKIELQPSTPRSISTSQFDEPQRLLVRPLTLADRRTQFQSSMR